MARRGFGWERRGNGEIVFRASRWTPTYVVSEEQLSRLRWMKMTEVLIALVTILPLAFLWFRWISGQGFEWDWLLGGFVAYAILNQTLVVYFANQRKKVIADAPLAKEPYSFPSLLKLSPPNNRS